MDPGKGQGETPGQGSLRDGKDDHLVNVVEIKGSSSFKTRFLKNGKEVSVRNMNYDAVRNGIQEMTPEQRKQTKRKVFYKLEKFFRLRKLERMLGIYEISKEEEKSKIIKPFDPERKLKAYMTSWEGVKLDMSAL